MKNFAGRSAVRHGSLFSGIGGFDLAAEWMGWENVFHCEKEKFCQQVLNYYWPNAKLHDDIRNTDFTIYRDRIDILTGGFPCQPYSQAGKRLGKEEDRHLWPEMLRAIREISPRWIVGENVLGLISWNGGLVFEEVQADLEAAGYEVLPFLLPAASVGAPHRRYRIWFVAYSVSARARRPSRKACHEGRRASENWSEGIRQTHWEARAGGANSTSSNGDASYADGKRLRGESDWVGESGLPSQESEGDYWANFPTQPPVRSRNDGLPSELDGITFSKWRNESIKGFGNAVVPQVVYQIFKAIEQYQELAI